MQSTPQLQIEEMAARIWVGWTPSLPDDGMMSADALVEITADESVDEAGYAGA